MSSIYLRNYISTYGIADFMVDSENDLENIELQREYGPIKPGSTAIVIETGKIFVLNGNNEWTKLGG